jgi:hypothetical protein
MRESFFMNNEGKWLLTVFSPLGEEEYGLNINNDGSGIIEHEKGNVVFHSSTTGPDGTLSISGSTDIPMTTTYQINIMMSDSSCTGSLSIGDFMEVPVKAIRV